MVKRNKVLSPQCRCVLQHHTVGGWQVGYRDIAHARPTIATNAGMEAHARKRILDQITGYKLIAMKLKNEWRKSGGSGKCGETLQFEVWGSDLAEKDSMRTR